MIVTLLTDFGTADYFVGALKGAVLSANPGARVVDITHEVPPFDIEAGAFTLRAAFETFPEGTVHVAVVDPGVGSARRGVAVEGLGHTFVGPDNGLFGHVYERVRPFRVFHLTNGDFFRRGVSATFHGRDIFAPVAGALSRGVRAEELGPEVFDFVRLPSAAVEKGRDGTLVGAVIHVDRFGNLVTNVTPEVLSEEAVSAGAHLLIAGREVRRFRRFFAEDAEGAGEPFAVWGSAGLLEVAVFRDSAARVLGAKRGDKVEVKLK
ncbi:MAG: SAM-dependent chlorinase/fluorinase [Acidobacteria bacterium]|nr:SAM-dependent chlorinase/fluorinase [Acidobacteriota bacterium]